jgi:ribosomal protein S18 acetylase RimI-like enzyme
MKSGAEESPKIRYARYVSPDVVLRNATSDDIFKILVDYLLPDVDLESLENGKILQVIADDRQDAILGYVIFDVVEPKSNGCGHITSIFVNPIFRREGVASKLVENAEKDLRDKVCLFFTY